jgi:hypothetical protein
MSARVAPKTSTAVVLPGADASLDLSSLNAHIAAELAAGLSDAAAVRERYGISQAQWDVLKASPVFRNMLAEAVRELRGDLNAGNRIQKKADIVLEDAIPAYDQMIHSKDIPAQAKIDAGKLLAQLAGRTAKQGENGAPAGGGFTLNINLGGGREKLVIDGKNIPAVATDE